MGTGSPSRLRVLNDQAALSFILAAGTVSRAELGRLTGLSKPGVAELLTRLESAGLVEKAGTQAGGPGPRAQTWRVRPGVACCAAVDLTPDGWSIRLLDLDGSVIGARRGPWRPLPVPHLLTAEIQDALSSTGVGQDKVIGVAVGVPGAVDPRTGIVRGAPQLPALLGYDFAGALSELLDVPVAVENDVNLMALAALADGLAEGARDFAFVWIDEGLGAAVVRNGELIRGFTGGAGEIDYVRVPDAQANGSGGKLGQLLSSEALHELVRDLGPGSGDPVAALDAIGETDQASPLAVEVSRRIAAGLAAIVTVLDPELILLGGRYGAAAGRTLAGAVRGELSRLLEADLSFLPDVRPYADDPEAALAGAQRLALTAARQRAFRSGSLPSPSGGTDHSDTFPSPPFPTRSTT
jgi:predicted NBD/HSP70 family sugar kinase